MILAIWQTECACSIQSLVYAHNVKLKSVVNARSATISCATHQKISLLSKQSECWARRVREVFLPCAKKFLNSWLHTGKRKRGDKDNERAKMWIKIFSAPFHIHTYIHISSLVEGKSLTWIVSTIRFIVSAFFSLVHRVHCECCRFFV